MSADETTPMLAPEYDDMAALEGGHWWYRTMRRILLDCLTRGGFSDGGTLVDVGCGTGGSLTAVRTRFPGVRYIGIDVNEKALQYSRRHAPARLLKASADDLPLEDASVDAVIAIDSLYFDSIDRVKALKGFYRILRPGGILLIHLPAFEILAGQHDEVVGCHHRYRLGELRGLLTAGGFEFVYGTYWNMGLFLPMLLWRWVSRLRPAGETPRSDSGRTPGWLDPVLTALLGLEVIALRRASLPFGSSVLALGRRPQD